MYPGLFVQVAARLMQEMYARASRGAALKPPLFGISIVIGAFPGIRQGTCAAALGFDATTFGRHVDRMVRDGYVNRTVPPEDRRAVSLSLTDKGREAVAAAGPVLDSVDSDIRKRMGAENWEKLTELLQCFLEASNHPLSTLTPPEKVTADAAP